MKPNPCELCGREPVVEQMPSIGVQLTCKCGGTRVKRMTAARDERQAVELWNWRTHGGPVK